MDEVDINAPSKEIAPAAPLAVETEVPQSESAAIISALENETASGEQARPTYVPEHKSHIAPVRTFSSDLAEAIREKGGSVVRIAMDEEEKHRREFEEHSAASKKNIAFVVIGSIIVLAAIGLVIGEYAYKKNASVLAPVAVQEPSSIISAEDFQTIDASGMQVTDMLGAVGKILASPNIQSGFIKNIVITQTANGSTTRIPSARFLTILGTHAPSDLIRSLTPDYMLGVYAYDSPHLFLIIRGTAHDFLLAGMLGWEPNLFADLSPLFGVDTSSLTPDQIANMKFRDSIIGNHDARAALDASQKPLLFYSFLDDDTVLIATDAKTFAEAVRRY